VGLKEDSRFARYITMGAHGSLVVARDLHETHGHAIVELERYAMANKLWSTKIKRLRLPDFACVTCGRRFESKGKTKLEVRLSHSGRVDREWDAGMRPEDVYAFLAVVLDENNRFVSAGSVVYFSVADMRTAWDAGLAKRGQLKGTADGSEVDVEWPMNVSKSPGTVLAVRDGRVSMQGSDLRKLGPRVG